MFYYLHSLLKPLGKFDVIKVASLEDILCMKANPIISQGRKKDFIDIYFIMKHLGFNGNGVVQLFKDKYGEHDNTSTS